MKAHPVFSALFLAFHISSGSAVLGMKTPTFGAEERALGYTPESLTTQSWAVCAFQAPSDISFSRSAIRPSYRSCALPSGYERAFETAYLEASPQLKALVNRLRAEDGKGTRRTVLKSERLTVHQHMGEIDGVLPVLKPGGITSMDVCRLLSHLVNDCSEPLGTCNCLMDPNRTSYGDTVGLRYEAAGGVSTTSRGKYIRGTNQSRVKVGHGGTLDPRAGGVIIIGIGRGTSTLKYHLEGSKSYLARVCLGTETDTADTDGVITKTAPWNHVSYELLQQKIAAFKGPYLQQPPLISAKRINGKPLYQIVREAQGAPVTVQPAPCRVEIFDIATLNRKGITLPEFEFSVKCSKGTYVRQLACDIAASLGTVAHLTMLGGDLQIRTEQSPFVLQDCLPLEGLTRSLLSSHLRRAVAFPAKAGSESTLSSKAP